VHRAAATLMTGIHRRQEVTDLGSAYLTHYQPVWTHPQRLTNKISKADRPGRFGVRGPTLDAYDMRMIGRQLARVLDDDEPLVGRHKCEKGC